MNSSTQLAPPPLSGAKLVLATFAVALATFMNVLDSSIANVAIPTISATSAYPSMKARGSSRCFPRRMQSPFR